MEETRLPLLQVGDSPALAAPSASGADVTERPAANDTHGFHRLVDLGEASASPGALHFERVADSGPGPTPLAHPLAHPQHSTSAPLLAPQPASAQSSAVDLAAVYSQMMLHFSMLSTKLELVSRKVDLLADRLQQQQQQQPSQQQQHYQPQQQQQPIAHPPLRDPIYIPAGLPGMPYPASASAAPYPYLSQQQQQQPPPLQHTQAHPPQPQHAAPALAQQPSPPARPGNVSPFVEGSSIPTRDRTAMCPLCFQYFEQPHIMSHIAVVHPEQQPQAPPQQPIAARVLPPSATIVSTPAPPAGGRPVQQNQQVASGAGGQLVSHGGQLYWVPANTGAAGPAAGAGARPNQ